MKILLTQSLMVELEEIRFTSLQHIWLFATNFFVVLENWSKSTFCDENCVATKNLAQKFFVMNFMCCEYNFLVKS